VEEGEETYPVPVEVDSEAVFADFLARLAPETVVVPRVDVAIRLRERDSKS
jgi:hypothetical protein